MSASLGSARPEQEVLLRVALHEHEAEAGDLVVVVDGDRLRVRRTGACLRRRQRRQLLTLLPDERERPTDRQEAPANYLAAAVHGDPERCAVAAEVGQQRELAVLPEVGVVVLVAAESPFEEHPAAVVDRARETQVVAEWPCLAVLPEHRTIR